MKTPLSSQVKFLLPIFLMMTYGITSHGQMVGKGLTKGNNCPYQKLKFTGSSTVTSAKGIELLDSLTAALELEKNALVQKGKINNKLKIRAAFMVDEVGKFDVPISQSDATEYVKLSSSICTLRKDLKSNKIFKTPEQRQVALNLYPQLLDAISEIKKKLTNP